MIKYIAGYKLTVKGKFLVRDFFSQINEQAGEILFDYDEMVTHIDMIKMTSDDELRKFLEGTYQVYTNMAKVRQVVRS